MLNPLKDGGSVTVRRLSSYPFRVPPSINEITNLRPFERRIEKPHGQPSSESGGCGHWR